MIRNNSLTLLTAISAVLAVPAVLAQDAERPELTGTWSNKSLTATGPP